MSRRRSVAAAAALTLLLTACATGNDVHGAPPEPTREVGRAADGRVDGWRTASPTEMGFRPHRLASLAEEAKNLDSSCYAVVRRGQLVHDSNWGTRRTSPREVYSVTKSVASALVGIAVRDQDLALDDPVSRYVRSWRGTASAGVTVRNLLSNDSGRFWSIESDYVTLGQAPDRTAYAVGLEQQHVPGSAWAYNNAAIQVLDRVLRRATGTPTDELAHDRLFEPLGMTHTRMTPDSSDRSTNTYFGVQTTCLDLARFGRLYLDGGAVGGTRLVSRRWVRASVGESSTVHNAAYGFLWWLNRKGALRGPTDAVDDAGQPIQPREGQLAPGAPADVFAAIGLGGQVVMADPGSETIVVRLGSQPDEGSFTMATATRVVTEALRNR